MTHSASHEGPTMDLTVWIPGTILLGLACLGLMYLFVTACDRV